MDSNTIFAILKSKSVTDQLYEVFWVEDDSCYFGKDFDNNVVFMIPSILTKVTPVCQETHSLRFAFNKRCTFRSDEGTEVKVVHLLTCKEKDEEKVKAFIRLTKAFAQTERENDQLYLSKLFSAISSLFDCRRQVSESELQGLFSELYVILHFAEDQCDIANEWQSRSMMKFDFALSEKKRLEIKSTLKTTRTHHFKHDQLQSALYDIKIVSILLRKSDYGLTLGELIEQIRDMYTDNYSLLLHVESLVSQVDTEVLYSIKYDSIYLKDNLRYYDAKHIPHFNERSPEGVFNAEYDCCLDAVPTLSEIDIKLWIEAR